MRKAGICFITGCFIKPLKWQLIFFYFSSSLAAQVLLFDIRAIKRRNWERQITRNGKLNIYFKNNFNLLVLNVTQLNFLNWQNVHNSFFMGRLWIVLVFAILTIAPLISESLLGNTRVIAILQKCLGTFS